MNVLEIEKLNQLISRTDMSGNEKVEWLVDFIEGTKLQQEQAKEMEKQQLKEMYLKGIENYDPTFKQQETMKTLHLINDTYQVVNEDETTVYFQGSKEECEKFKKQEQ
jgi:hypothetical protein